jgi:hypothetical protein
MIEIQVRHDRERGCGWRKPGGKYLIGGTLCGPCGKLPHFLDVCPTCSHGIKPMRGWRWIDAAVLFDGGPFGRPCHRESGQVCDIDACPLFAPPDRAGLIWIGDTFYRTPQAFILEACRLGISRRIACVPKGLVLGETLVLLASRQVMRMHDRGPELVTYEPGIFAAFVPTALEYVVRGDESEEDLQRLSEQGFTLVRIERVVEGGGEDEERSEGARPGPEVAGPPGVRPAGHGTDDDPARGRGVESGSVQ